MGAGATRIADGHTATVYDCTGGLVTYFAPGAPDFAETGELKGDELAAARRILDSRACWASGWPERQGTQNQNSSDGSRNTRVGSGLHRKTGR